MKSLLAMGMTFFMAAVSPVVGPDIQSQELVHSQETTDFDVNKFQLPQQAKVLVVVEGLEGADCMDTPFGQAPALEGFPENYIQVDESYIWEDESNALTHNVEKVGEHVGSAGYKGYYDYVIHSGFNSQAIPGKGAALFLHCEGQYRGDTSGCVAIEKDKMVEIMRLYGTYGDGACFIAQAKQGTFDAIYDFIPREKERESL